MKNKHEICPPEKAGVLDNWFRKLIHNPTKILGRYVSEGMKVLDIGCGPGLFSYHMAEMKANVIAADLQQEMLDKLENKVKGLSIEKNIRLVKTEEDNINVKEKVDFVLAFYMIHEVKGKSRLLRQINQILKPKSKFLIIEPLFHVPKKEFKETIELAEKSGFRIVEYPKVSLSRAVLLEKK